MSGKPAKVGANEVLGIETTTKAATKDAHETAYPISIVAVVLLNGSRRDTFHQLTNPGVTVGNHSNAHNGIKTADIKGADHSATALAQFEAFLAEQPDAIVVCHHAQLPNVPLVILSSPRHFRRLGRPVARANCTASALSFAENLLRFWATDPSSRQEGTCPTPLLRHRP